MPGLAVAHTYFWQDQGEPPEAHITSAPSHWYPVGNPIVASHGWMWSIALIILTSNLELLK